MKAMYYEDGWVAKVQILDDTSDAEIERLKLKIIETIEESSTIETPADEHVFDVTQRFDNYGEIYEVIRI